MSEYLRLGVFDIEDVLEHVGSKNKEYLGKKVKMRSHRYECFKHKGVVCAKCGLKGEFFALEQHKKKNNQGADHDRWHFNLYGYNEKGEEVMLTKDHVVPKSKEGKNEIDNYQTLCCKCNWKKGNNDD